jgi:hypothetical protein
MGNKAHPRESESREVSGLKGAICIADRNQQMEVDWTEVIFDRVEVIDKA